MIELKIDGRGYVLDDELRDEIHAKIGSLDGHMDGLQSGHVTVSWESGKNEQTEIHAQLWGQAIDSKHPKQIGSLWRPSTKLATSLRPRSGGNIARTSSGIATAERRC